MAGALTCLVLAIGGTQPSPSHALSIGTAKNLVRKVAGARKVPLRSLGLRQPCHIKPENRRHLNATLFTVNTVRRFAGLPPVTFSRKNNRLAYAAAVLMNANDYITHYPPKTWHCWSKQGYMGASTSNLSQGAAGPDAIMLYMDDPGVPSLGHRRWILNPGTKTMGSGSVSGIGLFNALYVGNYQPWKGRTNPVLWPARGSFPRFWIPDQWSATFKDWRYGKQTPSVNLRYRGHTYKPRKVRRLGDGYGSGTAFAWTLPGPLQRFGVHRMPLRVNISSPGSKSVLAHYAVRPFQLR